MTNLGTTYCLLMHVPYMFNMEALILVGGRVGGHTDTLCGSLSQSLSHDFSVRVINISELNVNQCTGCECCKGGRPCRFDDDMGMVIDAFDSADLIVFGTPVRFNGPSSQIKTVLDRFQSVWNDMDRLEHKVRRMCLLMTSGSDSPDPNPNLKIFRSFCCSFGGKWLGHAMLTGTDKGCGNGQSIVNELSDTISGLFI